MYSIEPFSNIAHTQNNEKANRIAKHLAAINNDLLALLYADDTAETLALLHAAEKPDPNWVQNRVQNLIVTQTTLLRNLQQLQQKAYELHIAYQKLSNDETTALIQKQSVLAPLQIQIDKTKENIASLQQLKRVVIATGEQSRAIDTVKINTLFTQLISNLKKGGTTI